MRSVCYGLLRSLQGHAPPSNLGHSTAKMLFDKYRALVKPDQAVLYFNIAPPKAAENIVELAAVA